MNGWRWPHRSRVFACRRYRRPEELMSNRSTIRYTYQDYLGIPEDPARRHEIVDGERHVRAAPRFRHQEVVGSLLEILRKWVRPGRLGTVVPGPVTVHLHDE